MSGVASQRIANEVGPWDFVTRGPEHRPSSAAPVGQLEAIGLTRRLTPHETLFFDQDDAETVYRLISGTVAGYKMTLDGRRQIVAFFFPGDLVGLSLGGAYAYAAEAIDDVTVCAIPRARLHQLATRSPALEKSLLAQFDRSFAAAQERLLLLGRKTAKERLATFLVECAERLAIPIDGSDGCERVPLAMSQADIGDYLGLASETVSRALADLKRDGSIEIMRPFDGVVITDWDRLEGAVDEG